MKFLSDELFIPIFIDDPNLENKYLTYDIILKQEAGVVEEVIYKGRIYYTTSSERYPRVYLNDILESYFSVAVGVRDFRDNDQVSIPNRDYRLGQQDMLYRVKLKIDTGDYYETIEYPESIYRGYMDLDLKPKFTIPNLDNTLDYGVLFNPQDMREGIYPRVPNLQGDTYKRFWIQLQWLLNDYYAYYGQGTVDVYGVKGGQPQGIYKTLDTSTAETYILTPNPTGHFDFINNETEEVWLGGDSGMPDDLPQVKLFDVDQCAAEYYVMWIDRLGCYQCQPFSKRNVMSEKTTTQMVTDYYSRQNPFNKQVEYEWNLNTDWIDPIAHRTFEGLLVSPYIYLYDTKKDIGIWCTCKSSSWENKTDRNNKRLFNFKVTLKSDRNQIMNY